MQVVLSLENLQADLESAHRSGDWIVHDYAENDRRWLRANSLAQLALDPLRFINQQIPTASVVLGGEVVIPSRIPETPPEMVHFGSEVTVNAAIGLICGDEESEPGDVARYHYVDPDRVADPTLSSLLLAYTYDEIPLAIFGLVDGYDGHWRPEDGQHEWFKFTLSQFYPDHREVWLPNSTLILGEASKEHIRNYFEISRAAWEAIESSTDPVDYRYIA